MSSSDNGKPNSPINDASTVLGGTESQESEFPETISAAPTPGAPSASAGFPFDESSVINQRWRLQVPLGKGGFGQVWRAYDSMLDKTVAVKFLDLARGVSRAQLANEVKQAQEITSPRVVKVHQLEIVRAADGSEWGLVIQEFVDGKTLLEVMNLQQFKEGLGEAELRTVLKGVLEGLTAIHDEELVHRDIKPSNIMIQGFKPSKRNFERVKIVDLGTCSLVGGGPGQLRPEHAGLTLAYAPPEQLESPDTVGPEADLFALGVTAMVAVSRRSPDAWSRPLNKHQEVLNGLSPDLKQSILRAVEQEPGARWPSATNWLAVLAEPAATRPLPASPPLQSPSPPTRTTSFTAVALVVGVLGFLAVAAVVAVLALGRLAGDPGAGAASTATPATAPTTATPATLAEAATPGPDLRQDPRPVPAPTPTAVPTSNSGAAAKPTPAAVVKTGFSVSVQGSGGGLGACLEREIAATSGLKAVGARKARHTVVVRVSASASPSSAPPLYSAYGRATATVDGDPVNLAGVGAQWTALGSPQEAAVGFARDMSNDRALKGALTLQEVCRSIAGSVARSL